MNNHVNSHRVREVLTTPVAKKRKTKAISDYFRHSIENRFFSQLTFVVACDMFRLDGKSALPPWSSLDGIPRIEGGLCIDYGDIITAGPSLLKREIKEKITIDYEICSTQDSPDEERVSSPLDHTDVTEITVNGHAEDPMENEQNCHQDENGFALENNYSYLTPDICETEPRNPSQVSGSSSDSGYQGNNSHRQRKIGVWRATSCECTNHI